MNRFRYKRVPYAGKCRGCGLVFHWVTRTRHTPWRNTRRYCSMECAYPDARFEKLDYSIAGIFGTLLTR